MTPDWIDQQMYDVVLDGVRAKRAPARLHDLRLARLSEGRCVQTLHIGPFDEEGEVLAQMHHTFIPERGLRLTGAHHEIYLSDPRKSAPERLRTILRQPADTDST